ncbi:MAG: hypothetical protein MHMPM18_004255, partial [Marteilia pararefringens]
LLMIHYVLGIVSGANKAAKLIGDDQSGKKNACDEIRTRDFKEECSLSAPP